MISGLVRLCKMQDDRQTLRSGLSLHGQRLPKFGNGDIDIRGNDDTAYKCYSSEPHLCASAFIVKYHWTIGLCLHCSLGLSCMCSTINSWLSWLQVGWLCQLLYFCADKCIVLHLDSASIALWCVRIWVSAACSYLHVQHDQL